MTKIRQTEILNSERVMGLLLQLHAMLQDYLSIIEDNELARRYQETIIEIKRVTDYFETFVIKRHYWPDKDVRVGDLWLICFDKERPFNTYAQMRIIAFTIDLFVPKPVGQYFQYPGMEGKVTEISWPCEFIRLLERNRVRVAEPHGHDYEAWKNDPELRKYLEIEFPELKSDD